LREHCFSPRPQVVAKNFNVQEKTLKSPRGHSQRITSVLPREVWSPEKIGSEARSGAKNTECIPPQGRILDKKQEKGGKKQPGDKKGKPTIYRGKSNCLQREQKKRNFFLTFYSQTLISTFLRALGGLEVRARFRLPRRNRVKWARQQNRLASAVQRRKPAVRIQGPAADEWSRKLRATSTAAQVSSKLACSFPGTQ
jgi:hypothetical protein